MRIYRQHERDVCENKRIKKTVNEENRGNFDYFQRVRG